MMADEVVHAAVQALESLGADYMMVGSFSSNLYGIPRSTQDADFVVELGNISGAHLQQSLGQGFRLDPQMSFETITGTYRLIATHPKTAFKVEFFLLSSDPHDRERFARRRRDSMPFGESWVATPEDVIITKLRWSKGGNRHKDITDVKGVIRSQRSTLDWAYVERWCEEHGTRELLNRTRVTADEE